MFNQQENTGNVIEYAIRYFHEMASTNKYHVRALLVGISMGVMTFGKGILGAPKGSIMVVDSRYPQLALQELSHKSTWLIRDHRYQADGHKRE